MKTFGFVATVLLLTSVNATAAETDTSAKIVDKKSPDYVRCVKTADTGSLIKKNKICRTNAQWRRLTDEENKDAADLIERSRAGMNPSG